MIINRGIKLGDVNYYIRLDCQYKMKANNMKLCLANYIDEYYDSGDLSLLIEEIENKYNGETVFNKYGKEISFLTDCLYIYENIPFISGVGDYYISTIDNKISSSSYVSKEELDNYIKKRNIEMNNNTNFKLCDSRTWTINKE